MKLPEPPEVLIPEEARPILKRAAEEIEKAARSANFQVFFRTPYISALDTVLRRAGYLTHIEPFDILGVGWDVYTSPHESNTFSPTAQEAGRLTDEHLPERKDPEEVYAEYLSGLIEDASHRGGTRVLIPAKGALTTVLKALERKGYVVSLQDDNTFCIRWDGMDD